MSEDKPMVKMHTHNESKLELCEAYVDALTHMHFIMSGLSDPTPEVENLLVEMQEVLGKAVNSFSSLTDDLMIFALGSEHNKKSEEKPMTKMVKKTNMTLMLRMKEDMRALILTELTRENTERRLSHVGYMYAISDSLDRLFNQLQGWELNISHTASEEISFPLEYKI